MKKIVKKPVRKPTPKKMRKAVVKKSLTPPSRKPLMYETPEALQTKVDEYFSKPPTRSMVINGVKIEVSCITITGLILHLGFAARSTFYDYEKKEAYKDIIRTARTRVEHEYEKSLQGQHVTGAIFALKNLGWKDENSGKNNNNKPPGGGDKPTLTIPLNMSPDEATKLYLAHIKQ